MKKICWSTQSLYIYL